MVLFENRKPKYILLYLLFVIVEISFYIIFSYLVYLRSKYSDTVFILDNRFAGDIIKRGKWLYIYSIDKHYDGKIKQLRIKESNVIRIDYYGEPIIIVEKYKE